MSLDLLPLITAFSLGVLGSLHCVVMCGGISCALASYSTAKPVSRLRPLIIYNLGRISSYTVIGFLFGLGSQLFIEQWQALSFILRGIAGMLLIAMGLYIAGVSRLLVRVEALGYKIWQRLMPTSIRRVNSESMLSLLLVGIVWGWLPCGLVYSTLLWAGTLGEGGLHTAVLMAIFGLGTLPAMLATGYFADVLHAFVKAKAVRSVAGFGIIIYGLWTVLSATSMAHALHGSHHNSHSNSHLKSQYDLYDQSHKESVINSHFICSYTAHFNDDVIG